MESFANLPLEEQDDNAKDGNMSELLELCSGQFQSKKEQQHLSETQELLGLCSGKFTEDIKANQSSDESKLNLPTTPDNEADQSFGFKIEEPIKIPIAKTNFDSDADNESENDERPIMIVRKKRHKIKCRDRARLEKFTEKEAELSGSDVGSDDEEGGASEDEYEQDIIAEELQVDDEMKQQVGKLHLRQVMNDEEEAIEYLKEAFATERPEFNRDRKFKWKNIDSDMTQNLFKCDSSDNDEDEVVAMDTQPQAIEDTQWRMERLQREEFLLNKQQNQVEGLIDEDSQFMQLGKKCVRKTSDASPMEPPRLLSEDSVSRDTFKKVPKGSFLNRPVEILNKLATFQDLKNAKGPSKSSKMVFKVASPSVSEAKKLGRRRKMDSVENVPPAKRMHSEFISEDSNSIFDLFK